MDAEEVRDELPSDDEGFYHEHDDDEDTRTPGEASGGEEGDDDAAEATEPAAAVPVPPAEPLNLQESNPGTVAVIKEHLLWRGVKPHAGNKEALIQQLKEVAAQPFVSVEKYLEISGGSRGMQSKSGAPKFEWEAVDANKIDRPVYAGEDKFTPNPDLGWSVATHPFTYMDAFYPKKMRDEQVENSARYRAYVKCYHKEVYAGQPDISPKLNSLAHCMLLLQGLNPVPDQRRMFSRSFAYKAHRGADLMTKSDWLLWKAYFHVSDPRKMPSRDSRSWDELHKIRPLLDEFLSRCIANARPGRKASVDEITIGFQGHHAKLKQRCGKFKRTGDGFQVCSLVPPALAYPSHKYILRDHPRWERYQIMRLQADTIVLEGGYVLYLVFRGDNTAPVYEKKFSPLHNRCLQLFSKLQLDGHDIYWDNLYPSVDVAQTLARGGQYVAKIPAGPRAGESSTISVPKIGTCGTGRTNRLGGAPCDQPKKQGLSEKALAAIKEKPLEQRVKSAMTTSEPRVIVASVFDNGPVHMIDTIHTSAGIITISKKRWDAEAKGMVAKPLRILQLIDDYNNGMDWVDVKDHLGHEYNLDGGFWRDRKWWHPIFKDIFKSACDQGYVCHKRVCEQAESKRLKDEEKKREQVVKAAMREAGQRGMPEDEAAAVAALAGEQTVPKGKKIKPMTHLDFLEKIAEGFVIEAYNSTKSSGHINLDAYDLSTIERALSEMRGEEGPSEGARGAAAAATPGPARPPRGPTTATPQTVQERASQGGKAKKRLVCCTRVPPWSMLTGACSRARVPSQIDFGDDGRLKVEDLSQGEAHPLIEKDDAVRLGLITQAYANSSNLCAYRQCPAARQCKDKECGEGCNRTQSGRARASTFCMHPSCMRFFHATCHSITHRQVEHCAAFEKPPKQQKQQQ